MLDINAHNPVARAIEKMQQKWAAAADPNYTVANTTITNIKGTAMLALNEYSKLLKLLLCNL